MCILCTFCTFINKFGFGQIPKRMEGYVIKSEIVLTKPLHSRLTYDAIPRPTYTMPNPYSYNA